MNTTRLIFVVAQDLDFVRFNTHLNKGEKKARKKKEIERFM